VKTIISSPSRAVLVVLSAMSLCGGCASLNVTQISKANQGTVQGVRYCLPKPFIQATPQADGTVSMDVVYFPDRGHCYAIDTSSDMSSYTFQIARDEKGLLTAIEYKASTTAVGQQLAASAGGAAVQTYNIKAAQLAATQTSVNTAQANLDTAKANAQAAQATLASDTANKLPSVTLASDAAAVAAANAKEQVAEQALQRTQATAQAVASAATAAAPASTTAPTMGTAFGQQAWNAPTSYSLPDAVGPVLFAINDRINPVDAKEEVELKAVTSTYPNRADVAGYQYEDGVVAAAQPTFETTASAIGPPTLLPGDQSVPQAAKTVTFVFDRPILSMVAKVTTNAAPPVDTGVSPKKSDDGKSISVDTTTLKAGGSYVLSVTIKYAADSSGHTGTSNQTAKFELT